MDDAVGTVSATGGSADTQAVDAAPDRWQTRRLTAFFIAAVAILVPFGASVAAAQLVGNALPRPSGALHIAVWWSVVIVVSTATLLIVDRAARRLLPLAALFRLALAFPDRAPSRYRVALRTGTVRQLTDRLRRGGDLGDTTAEAAENLIVLIAALGRHDRLSRGHSERVRAYADLIGAEMGLAAADRERLHWAALVHDVGKIRVRPEVLNKPGRPTADEWEELRAHPAHAATMLAPLRPWLGEWLDSATQHHERVDGRGYPEGLRGHEISLAGRIVAVADAYDCMTSARSYKKALPAAQARYELTRNSGTQFDAEVVRAMLRVSVGRMHLAAGPLCWLVQFPGFRAAANVVTGTAAPVSGMAGGAAVAAAAVVGGLAVPSVTVPSAAAAEQAAVPAEAAGEELAGEVTDEPRPAATRTSAGGDASTGTPGGSGSTGGDVAPATPGADAAPGPSVTRPSLPTDGRPTTSTTTTTVRPAPTTTTVRDTPTTAPPTTAPPTTSAPPTTAPTTTAPPTTTTTTTAPNSPPVAVDDARSVGTLSTVMIPVLANDHDADGVLDPSSLQIISGPSRGSATVSAGQIRYSAPLLGPLLGSSTTQVGYRICDDDGACDTAVLSITITLL